jgi:hypothetical protein
MNEDDYRLKIDGMRQPVLLINRDISEHTDLDFTHSYCPECAKKLMDSMKDT